MEQVEITSDLNPYDRISQEKEYQAWYYENITKPKRRIRNGVSPKNYFNTKQAYTRNQKKLNRAPRNEIIKTLFINHDDYHYTKYLTGKYTNGETFTRSTSKAKELAQFYYNNDLQDILKDNVYHKILDIVDTIKQHPAFNFIEAWTLLELTWRWTWGIEEDVLPYKLFIPEIDVSEQQLWEICPKNVFMEPISPIKLSDYHETQLKHRGKENIERETINHNELADEYREAYKKNALKALTKLKNNWMEATNEAFTPIILKKYRYTWPNMLMYWGGEILSHLEVWPTDN